MNGGLVRLCASGNDFAEDLSDYNQIVNNCFRFDGIADSVKEIFIYVNLPALPENIYWKNDVVLSIFRNIVLEWYHRTIIITNFDLEYIMKCNEMGKLNFHNLSENKRRKMSQEKIQIVIPLKLEEELLTLNRYFECKIRLDLKIYDISDLVDGEFNKVSFGDITFGLKYIRRFYHGNMRRKLSDLACAFKCI